MINEEAHAMLDIIMENYLQKHLPADRSSTLEIWEIRSQAKQVAEEIVLADIVYRFH